MTKHHGQPSPPPPSPASPASPAGPAGTPDSTAALRAQLLATEHWSLLATRGTLWQEVFSRTGTFLTTLSATMVALSLVVQATGFEENFRTIALLVLPLVLLIGITTFIRLVEADLEDAWIVIGMNRLRHAYIDLAPDIEQYLVTGHHDDELGMIETYSFRRRVGVGHLLAGSPVIVGIIDAMLSGVLAATVCAVLGAAVWVQVTSGLLVGIVVGVSLILIFLQRVRRFFRNYRPRFPHPDLP
jgi:hypothetical protein